MIQNTFADYKDIRILPLKHMVYLLKLNTYFLLSANVMTVGSVSTFNPSILDSPPDWVCYILHTYYELVLRTLNKSQKLQVINFLFKKQKLDWRERGEAILCPMLKDCALHYIDVKFSHFVIYLGCFNRYRVIITI